MEWIDCKAALKAYTYIYIHTHSPIMITNYSIQLNSNNGPYAARKTILNNAHMQVLGILAVFKLHTEFYKKYTNFSETVERNK